MRLIKQFILTTLDVVPVFGNSWDIWHIENYRLYCDTDLEVCEAECESRKVILLGNVFDADNYEFSNTQILQSAVKQCSSYDEFLRYFDKFSGNFLVFSYEKITKDIRIFTDNAALRELYYTTSRCENIVAASQPVAIARLLSLVSDKDLDAMKFHTSKNFDRRRVFVGDATNFNEVKRLKPNYFLNFSRAEVERYFPYQKLENVDFNQCALKAANMIKGFLKAANHRKKLAIPVSAGWESRVLLAASKDFSNEAYYFVFKHGHYTENHQDIKTPKSLLTKMGLTFNVLEYSNAIDEETKAEIENIYSFPRLKNFGYILNVYGKIMKDYFILNGNVSEIARTQFDDIKMSNKSKIAFLEMYPFDNFAMKQYDAWLKRNASVFSKFNYRKADMLYWEENCSNWVSKTCSEVRFVSEMFQPFNSRELLTTMMSVDIKYRWKQNPILYKKIIELLWPECLLEPINPSPKKQIISFLQKVGIYSIYREIHVMLSMSLMKLKK